MKNDIGTFIIESGVARISDPCYTKDDRSCGVIKNVKKGTWNAIVLYNDDCGKIVSELIVSHNDFIKRNKYTYENFEVGVDSGQAGVFDNKYYLDDSSVAHMTDKDRLYDGKICKDEPWYSWCCDRTSSKSNAGVIPFGAVSSSGYGDGVYSCCVHKNNDDEIDSIKIIFIGYEEDEARE